MMLRLVWAIHRHAEVIGLFFRELGQLYADAFEEHAGDFLAQMLRLATLAIFQSNFLG